MPKLFDRGRTVITPAALEYVDSYGIDVHELLRRHRSGDWGDVNSDDWNENQVALKSGARVLSVYLMEDGSAIWIITDAANEAGEREVTTVLFPDDY